MNYDVTATIVCTMQVRSSDHLFASYSYIIRNYVYVFIETKQYK